VADVKAKVAALLGLAAARQILLFEFVNLPATASLDVLLAAGADVAALALSLSVSSTAGSSTGIATSSATSATSATSPLSVYVFDANWVNLDRCPLLPALSDVDELPDSPVAAAPAVVAPGVAVALLNRERVLASAAARVNTLRRRLEMWTERCGSLLREQTAQRAAIEATVKNLVDFHISRVARGFEKTATLVQHHLKEQARVMATFDADARKLEQIALHPAVAAPRFRTLADLVDVAGYRLRADVCQQLAEQLSQKLAASAQLVKQCQNDAATAAEAIAASLIDAAPFHSQLARLRDAASTAVVLEARLHAQHKTVRAAVERGGAAPADADSGGDDASEVDALQRALAEVRALYARCVPTRQAMCEALFDAMRREKPVAELVDKAKLELGSIRPALRKWRTDIARLHDVRRYPIVYVDALAEVARRRKYAQSAHDRFAAFANAFTTAHDAELNRRRVWNRSNLRFVAPLFPAPTVPGASPALGATSLAELPKLMIECPELDAALPRIELQDASSAAAMYGIALGEAAAPDSDSDALDDVEPSSAAPVAAAASAAASAAAAAAAAAGDVVDLQVYQQRIKELEERLDEQFARAQSESMDKSMSDATSAQLRRARRAQLDAEKQVAEIGERLAAAVARAADAERQLQQATREHEQVVKDLTENAAATVERDTARAERDAALASVAELEKERENYVQVVAAANQARAKSSQAASESRALVESLQAQLAAAERRVHELEAARAETVVEVDEVRASRERLATNASSLQAQVEHAEQRVLAAEQRAESVAQQLADERARRALGDDALKHVVAILSGDVVVDNDDDDDDGAGGARGVVADLPDRAVRAAQDCAKSKPCGDGATLEIGIGKLGAGSVALFIPRQTREAAGSVAAQYVYEAVTLQSGSLSSVGEVAFGHGNEPRYFLDGNAADAFQSEVEKKLPIVGEIVECIEEGTGADAPALLSFLKPSERYALVIVSRV
jgi:hypothetical protein